MYSVCGLQRDLNLVVWPAAGKNFFCGEILRKLTRLFLPKNIDVHTAVVAPILRLQSTVQNWCVLTQV